MKNIKIVMPAEYEVYVVDNSGKLYAYKDAPAGPTLWQYPDLNNVQSISTGLRNAAVITDNGDLFAVYRSGPNAYKSFKVDSLIAAVQTSSVWSNHFVLKTDGTVSVFTDADRTLYTINVSSVGNIVKIAVGERLYTLNDRGEIFAFNFGPWSTFSPATANTVVPTRVTTPVAQDIAASRHGYAVAVCNGYPHGWGSQWGYLGLNTPPPNNGSVPLKDVWHVQAPIAQIAASDQTIHYIDVNGDLWGLGDNVQGEVGIGSEAPYIATTHAWNGITGTLLVKQAQHIAPGRKFVKLGKSTTMAYYSFAKEDNGMWNSWGRNKGGVIGNGIFMSYYDSTQPNWADVTSPRRVDFPVGTHINNSIWFTIPGNYPPAEATLDIIYSSELLNVTFTKTCDALHDGSAIVYVVPAGRYTSTVSQADANALAASDAVANGQSFADTLGICTLKVVAMFTGNNGTIYTLYADNTWK